MSDGYISAPLQLEWQFGADILCQALLIFIIIYGAQIFNPWRKYMKKKVIYSVCHFLLFFVFAFVLVGCFSTPKTNAPIIYDPNIPEELLCNLEISGGLHVIRFAGVAVGGKPIRSTGDPGGWGPDGYTANKNGNQATVTVRIPSGDFWLFVAFLMSSTSSYAEHPGIPIQHEFVAGHTYRLKAILYFEDKYNKTKINTVENYFGWSEDWNLIQRMELVIEDKGILP
jgi:hypothetical protein